MLWNLCSTVRHVHTCMMCTHVMVHVLHPLDLHAASIPTRERRSAACTQGRPLHLSRDAAMIPLLLACTIVLALAGAPCEDDNAECPGCERSQPQSGTRAAQQRAPLRPRDPLRSPARCRAVVVLQGRNRASARTIRPSCWSRAASRVASARHPPLGPRPAAAAAAVAAAAAAAAAAARRPPAAAPAARARRARARRRPRTCSATGPTPSTPVASPARASRLRCTAARSI